MSDQRIEAEITINAPMDAIWEAWVDPTHLAGWFVDEARGRIGSVDEVTWIWQQLGVEVEYDVVAVDPGRRFELRADPHQGEARTTEVTLSPQEGGHQVRVVESGLGSDRDAVLSGWQMALGLLKVYVEDYFGQPVRSVIVMGKADSPPEDILALQRTEEGLSKWLDVEGPLPEEGERVRLVLEEGVVLEGRVLRRTALETSFAWPWIQGVLEVKQFPVGGERAAALRAFTWADELEVDLPALQEALTRTLSRFVDALD